MDTELVTYITNTDAGPSETILIRHKKVDQTLYIDLCVGLGVKQSPDLVGEKPAGADEYELQNIKVNVKHRTSHQSNNNFQSFKLLSHSAYSGVRWVIFDTEQFLVSMQ